MKSGRKPVVTGQKLIGRSILDSQKESFRTVHAGRPEIPHKPKQYSSPETNGNGHGQQNGKHSLDVEVVEESKGIKRGFPDDESPPFKKAKIANSADDVVIVEDAGGAIVIDD
jgi:ubiquitin-like 1-activating enzyme E1 B